VTEPARAAVDYTSCAGSFRGHRNPAFTISMTTTTSSSSPPLIRREHLLYLAAAVFFLLVAAALVVDPLRVNYDVAVAISIARLLLKGATPYVDYVNLNPPLIHYLHVVPAWVAERLAIHPIITFSWLVMGLTAWTLIAVRRLCRSLENRQTAMLIEAVVVLNTALISWKLSVNNALGQREHLFVLLFLPYLLLRWLRLHQHQDVGRNFAIVIGILAAIGICLKPHFVLIWIAAEAFLVLQMGSLRKSVTAELPTLMVVGLAYAAHFLVLPVAIRSGIRDMLQLLSSGGYRVYGDYSPFEIFTSDLKIITLALAPFVLVRDHRGELGSLLRLSGVLVLASLAEVALQARGFFYHGIPVWTWMYLIVLLATFGYGIPVRFIPSLGRIRGKLTNAVRQGLTAVAYVLILGSFLGWSDIFPRTTILAPSQPDSITLAIAENSQEDDTVHVLSTGTGLFRSVLQADRLVGSKYFPDFPIAFSLAGVDDGLSLYDDPAALPDTLGARLSAIEQEILRAQPDLIVVDGTRPCSGCPAGLDLVSLLSRTGFTERVILARYSRIGVYDGDELYRLIAAGESIPSG